jgi:hypothetical protein
MSVKVSWDPGWGCSRRTSIRTPEPHELRSTVSVISATSPDSRSSAPSEDTALCQRLVGISRTVSARSLVSLWPTTKRTPRDLHPSMNWCELPARVDPGDHLAGRRVDWQLEESGVEDLELVGCRP